MEMPEIQKIVDIARTTGDEILMPGWGRVKRDNKEDGSPVTEIDKAASRYIIDALRALTPDIPVVSEEAPDEENAKAMQSPLRWVIDPLDGTATYLEGPGLGEDAGFGVHIALVNRGVPLKGVAYFPAQKRTYFTGDDANAYVQVAEGPAEKLAATVSPARFPVRVAVPWVESKRPLSANGHEYHPVSAVGGEQICKVAQGSADLMWHDRPDKEGKIAEKGVFAHWDVAAAHAIIKAAGGDLYDMATGRTITYDNADFVVMSCVAGHPDMLKQIGFNIARDHAVMDKKPPAHEP